MTGQTFLVTGARAPVALHMARLLGSAGHRVILTDALARPLAAATRFASYVRTPSPRFAPDAFGAAVQEIVAREGVDLIVPTCEEVFHLARLRDEAGLPLPVFAPGLDQLAQVHDKHRFIELCAGLGLPVPETHLLRGLPDLDAQRARAGDMVFKPVWSRFAEHVLIRPDPRGLDAITPSPARPWVAQEYLHGSELCAYAIAHEGHVGALSAYRALARAGRGAAVAFAPVEDAAVTEFVTRFVEGTGWSGQISFDLMRLADGSVRPLECNPRATSGLHFFRDGAAFARMLAGAGAPLAPDVSTPQDVRLALWVYGLPAALGRGDLAAFRAVLRETEDLLDWPDDPGARRAQVPAMAEFAMLALRKRISLLGASTYDIEWNGPDQSAI
ncbi:hypothetical protein [Maritimibacter sp. UBA3975]|uniref:hypothetical protein n=1 Tax=Maritimibacter sp. UBA3975 TaxID=1946833 RepID=UPI000C0AB096|nr:hypothetical protein [Maritimibacter sp. UBA3975]MAM62004.1 hypothetical protein [Maritimibacter sp.]|tara:strand:+ start:1998 stop:3158 length:1161 start_codon:yes stop_codon:yes gene_type:complete